MMIPMHSDRQNPGALACTAQPSPGPLWLWPPPATGGGCGHEGWSPAGPDVSQGEPPGCTRPPMVPGRWAGQRSSQGWGVEAELLGLPRLLYPRLCAQLTVAPAAALGQTHPSWPQKRIALQPAPWVLPNPHEEPKSLRPHHPWTGSPVLTTSSTPTPASPHCHASLPPPHVQARTASCFPYVHVQPLLALPPSALQPPPWPWPPPWPRPPLAALRPQVPRVTLKPPTCPQSDPRQTLRDLPAQATLPFAATIPLWTVTLAQAMRALPPHTSPACQGPGPARPQ